MIKEVKRANGAVHDVARLLSLSDNDCNVLFVSSRTLYILHNYAALDVGFLSRYAREFFDGGYYDSVETDDTEAAQVELIANNFGVEVTDMSCDIFAAIELLTAQVEAINTNLVALTNAVIAGAPVDLTEQVDDVEEILDIINVVLGGAAVLA